MQKKRVPTRRLFTSLSPGQHLSPKDIKDVAQALESGHVCRNCESQVLRLTGGIYHWCPTCGTETFGPVSDICVCGAHVGKHDVMLRCAPVPEWDKQMNPLIRRKVTVIDRPRPAIQPIKLKTVKPELFEEEPD